MIDLGPHAIFIVSAYTGVALVTAGIILATVFDYRRKSKRLAALEADSADRSPAGDQI